MMARGTPNWLKTKRGRTPKRWREWWEKPWTVPQHSSRARGFKRVLWENGYSSPNFTRREMGGQDRNSLGTAVPDSLRNNCQFHSFGLERVRHDCGDKPMSPYGAYRNTRHNAAVGGASQSQHIKAWATDWDSAQRARLGGTKFDAAMNRHFANGGRGYQGHVGGPVRHVDNGPKRVWVYA